MTAMNRSRQISHDMLVAYLEDRTSVPLRDEIVEKSLPILEKTAQWVMCRKRPHAPSHIDEEELVSEGLIAVTPAVERFDPPKSAAIVELFIQHMRRCLRWRMLTHIRRERFMPRDAVKHAIRFKAAYDESFRETSVSPTLGELAAKLDISEADAAMLHYDAIAIGLRTISLYERVSRTDSDKNVAMLDTIDAKEGISSDFDDLLPKSLSKRERMIIICMYRDDMSQGDIAKALGITQSCVSLIYMGLIPRIRSAYFAKFGDKKNLQEPPTKAKAGKFRRNTRLSRSSQALSR